MVVRRPHLAKGIALLKWTGLGSLADLKSSVVFVLKDRGLRVKVSRAGNLLLVDGAEPIRVATVTEHLPGVAWTAVGQVAHSFGELGAMSGELARKYLRSGDRFQVEAEWSPRVARSDVAGVVTSSVIDAVKRSSVSPESPKVRFRASFDSGTGAVGVEVKVGPGGVPTGKGQVSCLVSGGMHSSVVSWMAVLGGFRVHMIHATSGEDSLLAVARLYSELSYRADPRWLNLTVVEGGSITDVLARYAEGGHPLFGGFRSAREAPEAIRGAVFAPLYLLPEERFQSEFGALGIKEDGTDTDWHRKAGREVSIRRFGGRAAEVNEVLDGLA